MVVALVVAVFLVVVRPFGGGGQPKTAPPTTAPTKWREAPLDAQGRPYRPFLDQSWWNTPVPAHAPLDPHGAQILNYLSTAPQSGGCLRLAGAQGNRWGQPTYWGGPAIPSTTFKGCPTAGHPRFGTCASPPVPGQPPTATGR